VNHRILFLLSAAAALTAGDAVPGATAAEWLANPEEAARKAGATAEHLEGMGAGFWAAMTGAAVTGLAVLKWATPLISRIVPVWGPMVEGVANLAWGIAATKHQKEADKALEMTHQAAAQLAPILLAVRSLPPGTLPDHVQQLLGVPIVRAAIDHVVSESQKA
jgi:hypothetical protein